VEKGGEGCICVLEEVLAVRFKLEDVGLAREDVRSVVGENAVHRSDGTRLLLSYLGSVKLPVDVSNCSSLLLMQRV
jgi:hypothetical protein